MRERDLRMSGRLGRERRGWHCVYRGMWTAEGGTEGGIDLCVCM